jgi:hypothetical protein
VVGRRNNIRMVLMRRECLQERSMDSRSVAGEFKQSLGGIIRQVLRGEKMGE